MSTTEKMHSSRGADTLRSREGLKKSLHANTDFVIMCVTLIFDLFDPKSQLWLGRPGSSYIGWPSVICC